ncbi:hypothetical protein CN374_29220 [Bacillus cereus]|nr:hypothetical protein CN374_29220 [Bacillus cereus]
MTIYEYCKFPSNSTTDYVKSILPHIGKITDIEMYPVFETPYAKVKVNNSPTSPKFKFFHHFTKERRDQLNDEFGEDMETDYYHLIIKDDRGNEIWLGNLFAHNEETEEILSLLGIEMDSQLLQSGHYPYKFNNLSYSYNIHLIVKDNYDQTLFEVGINPTSAHNRQLFLDQLKIFTCLEKQTTSANTFKCTLIPYKSNFIKDQSLFLEQLIEELGCEHCYCDGVEFFEGKVFPSNVNEARSISVSAVSSYFLSACKRQLYLNTFDDQCLKNQLKIEPHYSNSKLKREGFNWEVQVLSEITKQGYYYTNCKVETSSDVKAQLKKFLSIERNLTIDGKERLPYYIFSSRSKVPGNFYSAFTEKEELPLIKNIEIDLLEITKNEAENKYQVRVIDMKSNEEMKATHKIQVALYSMIVNEIIKSDPELSELLFIDLSKDGVGGVWTRKDLSTYQTFSLGQVLDVIHIFFQKEMTSILKVDDYKKLDFHVCNVCEECKFFYHCQKEAEEKGHISKLHSFSPYAANYLKELQKKNMKDDYPSIEVLKDWLQKDPSELERSESFKHRIDVLKDEIEVIGSGRSKLLSKQIFDLPKSVDHHIVMTIQKDPISGVYYGIGWFMDDTFKKLKSLELLPSSQEVRISEYESFIDQIYCELKKIQNNAHFYFYEKSEQTNFTNLLCEVVKTVEDISMKEKVQQILFLFYSSKLLNIGGMTPTHSVANLVPFPFTILKKFFTRHFALPISFHYSLEEVTKFFNGGKTLDKPEFAMFEDPQGHFTKMTDILKPDLLYQYWDATTEKEKKSTNNQLISLLENRIKACNFLVWVLENHKLIKPRIKREAHQLSLSPVKSYSDELSTKYGFITKYEAYQAFYELKTARQLSFQMQVDNGFAFHLKFIKDDGETVRYKVLNDEYMSSIEPFFRYVFSDGSDQSLEQLNSLNDLSANGAKTKEIDHDHKEVSFHSQDIDEAYKKDGIYYISQLFLEGPTKKIMEAIDGYDQNASLHYQIVKQPTVYNQSYSETISEDDRKELIVNTSFTNKQMKAYEHFLTHKLTLLWGPPGTGKTTFISKSLLYYCKKFHENLHDDKKKKESLRILITAQTHSAIENCLEKIIKLINEHTFFTSLPQNKHLGVSKFGGLRDQKQGKYTCNSYFSDIHYDVENDLNYSDHFNRYKEFLEDYTITITGATLIQAHNLQKNDKQLDYDIVIVDEASQVKIPESLIAVSAVKEKGRLLLSGDHYQLPPVFKANFVEEEKDVTHSLFSLLIEKHQMKSCQLIDNFRMNDLISGYSAEKIYNKGSNEYKACIDDIAKQQLEVIPAELPYLNDILAPNAPFTLSVLDGIQFGRDNEVEAKLVQELVYILADHFDKSGLAQKQFDEEIWKDEDGNDRLYIVCPHKAQKKLIKEKLDALNIPHPLIDTVEKAQGKEAEIVIISYAIADEELAHKELDFIYSLNRLNVSLTRAKKKVINFIPRKLFHPSYSALLDDKNIDNFNFFLGLRSYVDKQGNYYEKVNDQTIKLSVYHKRF